MKPATKTAPDTSKLKSIIELVEERIPNGKFKGLIKLLDPHEQLKSPKRSA